MAGVKWDCISGNSDIAGVIKKEPLNKNHREFSFINCIWDTSDKSH